MVLGDGYNGSAIVGGASGAFQQGPFTSKVYSVSNANGNSFWNFYFYASLSNSIYGNSTTVTPLSITTAFAIKY